MLHSLLRTGWSQRRLWVVAPRRWITRNGPQQLTTATATGCKALVATTASRNGFWACPTPRRTTGATVTTCMRLARGFATRSNSKGPRRLDKPLRPNDHKDGKDQDPHTLFLKAKSTLMMPPAAATNPPAELTHQVINETVSINLTLHENAAVGLNNAIELATLAAEQHPDFMLQRRIWNTVLLKMVQQDFPLEQMIHWMNTQPVDNLTKEIIYVVANAFTFKHRPKELVDTGLCLVNHYIHTKTAMQHVHDRTAALNYLLKPLLQATPSIFQLEQYLHAMRSSDTPVHGANSDQIARYYLDPAHHPSGRPLKDIAQSFLMFLHENRHVMHWRSKPPLDPTEDPERFATRVVALQQRLESLMQMDHKLRAEFLLEDPESSFQKMKSRLTISGGTQPDRNFIHMALFYHVFHQNAEFHDDPSRGVRNAIQLVNLATWRQKEFTLAGWSWQRLMTRMLELQLPAQVMIEWFETHPTASRTKDLVFVVSSALDTMNQLDFDALLALLASYTTTKDAKRNKESRSAVMNFLLGKLLLRTQTKPTIAQLEQYIDILRMSFTPVSASNSPKVVAYYLDPRHHDDDRPFAEIASRFLQFLQANHRVIHWHSSLTAPPAHWNGESYVLEANDDKLCAELVRQLETLMHLDAQERDDYLRAVTGILNNPEQLYALARKRSRHEPAPLDYDLCARAVFANVFHAEKPACGLAKAIEIANWMAPRPGFELPAKTWHAVLLKMIEHQYPLDELLHWMNTQRVTNKISAMIYVLSNALSQGQKPDVVVTLLSQGFGQVPWRKQQKQDRSAALGYLLLPLLKADPGLDVVDAYVALWKQNQTRMGRSHREALVQYYVNPLHHEPLCSLGELAMRFETLCRANQTVFWNQPELSLAKLVGSELGKRGSDGLPIAKELVEIGFQAADTGSLDATVHERTVFAEAVLNKLANRQDKRSFRVVMTALLPLGTTE